MMTSRKSRPAAAFAVASLMILALQTAQAAAKKVGVISWNDSEPRYTVTKQRMLEEIKAQGLGASDVVFFIEDAKGKKDKIAEILKKLSSEKVDIYVALGTSAAVPTAGAIKDKPLVIGMVYDPVESKIAKDWKSSGNNVTGSSSFVSIPSFLRRLVKRSVGTYAIKRVSVPWTPGEKNSEIQLKGAQSVEAELGIKITPVSLANEADVAKWVKEMPGSADLIMVTGSNVIGTHIGTIVNASIKAKIPTATHLDDLVERGILFGLVADVDEVGKLTGQKLAQVVKGAEPATIPIEAPSPKLLINQKTTDAGKFSIPPAMRQWAQGTGG